MEIDAGLAAELAILTAALDDPAVDIAASLVRLAANARAAVASYRGLMVLVSETSAPIRLTAMDHEVEPGEIRTSLMLSSSGDGARPTARVSLILFAAVPGAFVDLAADLTWMTGPQVVEIVVDQHLDLLSADHGGDTAESATAIQQALGLLIGHGFTPEQAEAELDARAADTGTERHHVATALLSAIPAAVGDSDPDPMDP